MGERGGKIMVDGGAEELCLEPKQEDLKKVIFFIFYFFSICYFL